MTPADTAATSPALTGLAADSTLTIGRHTFSSRLFVGTGKYSTYELMQACLAASGSEVITVAVRRERLIDRQGREIGRVEGAVDWTSDEAILLLQSAITGRIGSPPGAAGR